MISVTKQNNIFSIKSFFRKGDDSRIIALVLFLISVFVLSSPAEARYGVSGVVSFSYEDYQSKIGDQKISSQIFSQQYSFALSNYVWDPRFMVFTANIGYAIQSPLNTGAADTTMLTYGLNTTFFPKSSISMNLFGNKAVSKVDSRSNIAGFEVTTTSYGGSLRMALNSLNNNGNRNNDNNNNNNDFGGNRGRRMVLPNINLSHVHTESESQNSLNPIQESRDDSRVLITYRPRQRLDMSLEGGLEQYKNEVTGFSYDTTTAGFKANSALSSRTALSMFGRYSDRTVSGNLSGYESRSTSFNYGMMLNTTESARLSHRYQFERSTSQSDTIEVTEDRARAGVYYMVTPELQVHGALTYDLAESRTKETAIASAQTTDQTSGAISAGANYNKSYTPDFLGPFSFNTSYGFEYGFFEISSTDPSIAQGKGSYYTNSAGAGLASRGWDKETFSLGYRFSNRRDHSPAGNNNMNQNFNLGVSTRRIPKTTISANANYSVQESSSKFNIQNTTQTQTEQQRRSVTYTLSASHATTQSLSLNAGASRGQSTSMTEFTLSTLGPPTSGIKTDDTAVYAGADFNHNLTRNVLFRANAREEFRSTDNGVTKNDTQSHIARMNLDYRMRMIFVNFEYRWRQDTPEGGLTTTQQYFLARLTRPF